MINCRRKILLSFTADLSALIAIFLFILSRFIPDAYSIASSIALLLILFSIRSKEQADKIGATEGTSPSKNSKIRNVLKKYNDPRISVILLIVALPVFDTVRRVIALEIDAFDKFAIITMTILLVSYIIKICISIDDLLRN
jgi:hypothetical protein